MNYNALEIYIILAISYDTFYKNAKTNNILGVLLALGIFDLKKGDILEFSETESEYVIYVRHQLNESLRHLTHLHRIIKKEENRELSNILRIFLYEESEYYLKKYYHHIREQARKKPKSKKNNWKNYRKNSLCERDKKIA